MEKIKTLKGNTLFIEQDTDAENPRTGFDNLCTMACFHKRYQLGDYSKKISIEQAREIEQSTEYYKMPLFLYDHSGLTIATTPFDCPWDSGQVGIIFLEKSRALNECPMQSGESQYDYDVRISSYLEQEVKTYNAYLTGDVWGFIVENSSGENIDSCWGFYSTEDAKESGLDALKSLAPRQLAFAFVPEEYA